MDPVMGGLDRRGPNMWIWFECLPPRMEREIRVTGMMGHAIAGEEIMEGKTRSIWIETLIKEV
jgi:hypothetical protein